MHLKYPIHIRKGIFISKLTIEFCVCVSDLMLVVNMYLENVFVHFYGKFFI